MVVLSGAAVQVQVCQAVMIKAGVMVSVVASEAVERVQGEAREAVLVKALAARVGMKLVNELEVVVEEAGMVHTNQMAR